MPIMGSGLYANAISVTLSSTATVPPWTGVSVYDAGTVYGDPAVRADLANNRLLLNAPGRYRITAMLDLVETGTDAWQLAVYKNGVQDVTLTAVGKFVSGAHLPAVIIGYLNVAVADAPGTIQTMAAPSGTFTGASGAPYTECAVDLRFYSASGTGTVTASGQFLAERVDG